MRLTYGPETMEKMEVDEDPNSSNDSSGQFARFYFAQNRDSPDRNPLNERRSQSPALTFEDVVEMRLNPQPVKQEEVKEKSGPFTPPELEALAKEIAAYSDQSQRIAKVLATVLSNRATQFECSLLKFDVECPHQCWKSCMDVILPLYRTHPKSPEVIERALKICDGLLSNNKRKAYEIVNCSKPDELADMLINVASGRFSDVPEEGRFFVYATIVLLGTDGFRPFDKKVIDAYCAAKEINPNQHEGTSSYDVIMMYMLATRALNINNFGSTPIEDLAKLLSHLSHCCFTDFSNPLPKSHYEWITQRFRWKTKVSELYGNCNQLVAFIMKSVSPDKEEYYAKPKEESFCVKVSKWVHEMRDKLPAEVSTSIWDHIFRYSVARIGWFETECEELLCWNPPNTVPQFVLYTDWLRDNEKSAKRTFDVSVLPKVHSQRIAGYFFVILTYLQQVELGNDDWIDNLTRLGIKHCRSLVAQILFLLGKHEESKSMLEKFLREPLESEALQLQVFQMQLYVLTNDFVRSIEFGLELLEIPKFRTLTDPLRLKGKKESIALVPKNAFFDYILTLIGHSLWRLCTQNAETLLSELTTTSCVLFGQFAWHMNGFQWIRQLAEFMSVQTDFTYKADLTEYVSYAYCVVSLLKLPNAKLDSAAVTQEATKHKGNRPFVSQQKFAKFFFENKAKFERFEGLTTESASKTSVDHDLPCCEIWFCGVELLPFWNIKPGTVVDTGAVHPVFSDFYLDSHVSLQGTSKTPRYTVLKDESGFDMDVLEKMTNTLVYGDQIVTVATSLPAPAYIASRYADCGRNLYNACPTQWSTMEDGQLNYHQITE